jgi:hypothetical protein
MEKSTIGDRFGIDGFGCINITLAKPTENSQFMKNIILLNSKTRRSPLAPLQKGGKYFLVPLFKGSQYAHRFSRLEAFGMDLGESRNKATYSNNFLVFSNKIISLCGLLLLATAIAIPAKAHELKTQQDVGATMHIEPNDAPRAGETALTWFALTKKGGQVIPLNQCNCKLSLYSQPHTEGTAPLQQPILKAVSQEGYQGIPATEVTFPAAGSYELELQGTPKAGAKFAPFELQFEVNVAPGIAAQSPQNVTTQVAPQKPETSAPWSNIAIAVGTIFSVAIAFLVWQKLRRKD